MLECLNALVREEEFIAFVQDHLDDDPIRLLLQQERYPGVDMRRVAQQIEGHRQASTKWPTLAGCGHVLYPPKLNREQSSSEATARMKVELLRKAISGTERVTAADLTGGMGIDSMALASLATHVDYVEHDEELCRLMEHNCMALGIGNISIHCGDSIEWLDRCGQQYDIIFADPARRDSHGRKVAAFEDCTPNIIEHRELIANRCKWLVVKASPMIDIDMGMSQMGNVSAVHVVAVKGECKEVVFVCRPNTTWEKGEAVIYAHNIGTTSGDWHHPGFRRSEEAAAKVSLCEELQQYIYEPDAALMKSGPYKLLCQGGRLEKLDRNSHLYTSDELMEWSGRVFHVISEVALNRKAIADLIPGGRAHVVVRNYPAEASELQKRLGLKEGGEVFVVATTVRGERKGIVCRSVV